MGHVEIRRILLVTAMLSMTACASVPTATTASPPASLPDTTDVSNAPPQPHPIARGLKKMVQSAIVGSVVGAPMGGPAGAAAGAVVFGIYGLVTWDTPFDIGYNRPTPPNDRGREGTDNELETEIEGAL